MKPLMLAAALTACATVNCLAEETSCNAVLAKDTVISHVDDRVSLAALQLVTIDNYKEFQSKFAGGVKFPIDGIPIGADTSYDQFDKERQSYLKKYSYDYNQSINKSIALSYTTDEAIDAWVQCIQGRQKQTIILRPKFDADDILIIQAQWIPGDDLKPGRRTNYSVTGGKEVSQIPTTFLGGWTTMKFKRDKAKAFSLDINMADGGTAGHIDFPAASTNVLQGDLRCSKWIESGCIEYSFPLNDEKHNFQRVPVGSDGVSYLVRGMSPNADMRVSGKIDLTVDEYPSAIDEQFIVLGVQIDNTPKDSRRWVKHWAPGPVSALINQEGKVSKTGQITITISSEQCYWANPRTTAPNYDCHVSAAGDSSITIQALAPQTAISQKVPPLQP